MTGQNTDIMAEEESSKAMKITVKTPKEKQEIEIGSNAHVKEVRCIDANNV